MTEVSEWLQGVYAEKNKTKERKRASFCFYIIIYISFEIITHFCIPHIFFGGMDCSKHSSKRQTGVNFNYFIHMYAVLLYTQLLLLLLLSLIYHLVETEGMRHEMPTAQHKYKLHYTYSRLLYKKIWKKNIKQLLN